MGLSRQECWGGLLCPSPRDFPDQGIKPASPVAPELQTDSSQLNSQGSPSNRILASKSALQSLFAHQLVTDTKANSEEFMFIYLVPCNAKL